MKKAIMARLTNHKADHKSPSSSSVNSHASSGASLTTMTSSCAAMGKSVFPLLNVAYSFQGSWNCGCQQDVCNHKIRRNPSWHSGESFYHTTHLSKQMMAAGLGTPTLATVMECYDGEKETSFGFDFDLRNHSLPSLEGDSSAINSKIHKTKKIVEMETKEATTLRNTFAFDFGGTPFESNKLQDKVGRLNEEEKVKEVKRSCTTETIIADEQKINWVEVSESEVRYEKKLTSSSSLGVRNDKIVKDVEKFEKESGNLKGVFLKSSTSTKVIPPNNLKCFSLVNPIKITDSFESPAIEVSSLTKFHEKMNTSKEINFDDRRFDKKRKKLEIRSDNKIPQLKCNESYSENYLNSNRDCFNNNIIRPDNINQSPSNNQNLKDNQNKFEVHSQKSYRKDSNFTESSFHSTPHKFGNCVESCFNEQDNKDKEVNFFHQPFKKLEEDEHVTSDGFNMANFEKLFLSKGSIKYADDNEDAKNMEIKELMEKDESNCVDNYKAGNANRIRWNKTWSKRIIPSNEFSSDDPRDYEDSKFSYDDEDI